MEIAENKVAILSYTLTTDGGRQIIELIRKEHPRAFIFGAGVLLEGFESAIMGMKTGNTFDFTLKAEQAYGPRDTYAIFNLPKNTFEVDGKIDESVFLIGNEIPMSDNEGNRHIGVVREIKEDAIVMDFNHPMAGKDLHFKGEIIEVRDVTQDELDSLNHSCGCGSHEHENIHIEDESCPTCGNAPEDQRKNIGNCKCN
ncbi:MAG: peptidylprolyl isomerase [Bacteroidetes bacterium]|nr:peptidylprolyl isomerase [Bacteroidota bacterium]